jgi:dTDP-4-dehydrorhamnose 3,5-epimerase
MDAITTKIKDCVVFSHAKHCDERGFFVELYNANSCGIMGHQDWRQINCSHSRPNVVRGLHIAPFAKLVTCVKGHVWDVVVDMKTLQWVGVDLSDREMNQIYVPPNCARRSNYVIAWMQ